MSEFYIMNATNALHGKLKVGIEAVVTEMASSAGTIFVCEREHGFDAYQRILVSSYGLEEAGELPRSSTYTEDTGLGYRNKNKGLRILNVIQKSKDGSMTPANQIGMGEKLPHWVCK